MLIGCIADDFTGASDLANTLALRGMATTQFVGIPKGEAPAGCEAGVVALKTRSIPAGEAVAQSLDALAWLKRQGCRQYFFKYCSTFDSTPAGNIGPVAEALLDALGGAVAIACPAFPATGRTVYQGHLFVNDRLLNESGLERHPLNPMTDPDLRRWLRRQTRSEVGLVAHAAVRGGAAAVREAIEGEAAARRRLVILDAVEDGDLMTIGEAVADHILVTGGSGVALGLPENFRRAGLLSREGPRAYTATKGPGVALSGSCSPASLAQVARYGEQHPALRVDPVAVAEGRQTVDEALRWALSQIDGAPLVTSTADPAVVAAAQASHGRERVAEAVEGFFGALAAALVAHGVVRLAVGGGETSGAVVQSLGATSLTVGPEIDPGVPALMLEGTPVRVALKSGNFGGVDFFERALRMLGEP